MAASFVRPNLGTAAFYAVMVTLATYFTFAAVQGDYGLFRRVEITAETHVLTEQRDALQAELARLENLIQRLSDTSLDLDLLDERARAVLGHLHGNEIIIR